MIGISLRWIRDLFRAVVGLVSAETMLRFFPMDIICLGYHTISNQRLPHNLLYPYKNIPMFECDLLYIKDHFGRAHSV